MLGKWLKVCMPICNIGIKTISHYCWQASPLNGSRVLVPVDEQSYDTQGLSVDAFAVGFLIHFATFLILWNEQVYNIVLLDHELFR